MLFKDRVEAGTLLADLLGEYRGTPAIILGLARGGVVTGCAVGSRLGIPVDVLVVKKIASPGNAEYAIGAVAPDNISVIRWKEALSAGADEIYVANETARLSQFIQQRMHFFRRGRKRLSVSGRTVIITDDGAATGATMKAAVLWAKKRGAGRIIAAVPVASREAGDMLRSEADACVIYREELDFGSVGNYYQSFPQVTDDDVVALLKQCA